MQNNLAEEGRGGDGGGRKEGALWEMCKWRIKYTAALFSQNRLFQRRRSVLKRRARGRVFISQSAIPISLLRFSKIPFALFDRWHKQTSLQSSQCLSCP